MKDGFTTVGTDNRPSAPGRAARIGNQVIATEQTNQALRQQVMVTFAIDGDLRFLSHLDMLRLFARSIARAELPVHYSQGFNPKPKLWLPLPRPVGITARRETLIVEFFSPVDPETVFEKLAHQMPEGITLLGAENRTERKMPQPEKVSYAIDLDLQNSDRDHQDSDREYEHLRQAVDELMRVESRTVTRNSGRGAPPRTIDVRRFLEDLSLNQDRLTFTLLVSSNGGARPVEVLEALGVDPKQFAHRIERTCVIWA